MSFATLLNNQVMQLSYIAWVARRNTIVDMICHLLYEFQKIIHHLLPDKPNCRTSRWNLAVKNSARNFHFFFFFAKNYTLFCLLIVNASYLDTQNWYFLREDNVQMPLFPFSSSHGHLTVSVICISWYKRVSLLASFTSS